MALLNRDQILKADDLTTVDVDVPEWGGSVRVRGMTGIERDRWEIAMAEASNRPDKANIRAAMVARCVIDEDGHRVFTDRDVDELGKKSGVALARVFDQVRELSGMGDDTLKEKAEDFDGAPSDGSTSD